MNAKDHGVAKPAARRAQRIVAALLAAMIAGAVLAAPTPASATSTYLCRGYDSCANSGRSHYGYKTGKSSSYWRMTAGNNCTNYVAYRFVKRAYDSLSNTRPWSGDGMAYNWGRLNADKRDGTPKVGAVAWWDKSGSLPSGHVAYVERVVSSTEIIISESNWGGNPEFAWRKITKSGGGWPTGFIHFKDERLLSTTAPKISGTAKVGSTLSVSSKGSWRSSGRSSLLSGVTVAHSYTWYANGKAISGATSSKLALSSAHLGKKITVKVKAGATGYRSGEKTSGATGAVAAGTLSLTKVPLIAGQVEVGSTLTAVSGTWSPAATTTGYQWLAGGIAIPGATSAQLLLDESHLGMPISVRQTASRAGYTTATATSAPTVAVVAAPLPEAS